MSTPAQVTDAHRQLAKSIGCDPASEYCPQNVDADAQLIADSEARAVEPWRTQVEELRGALALGQENCDDAYEDLRDERDAARAEVARLREIGCVDTLLRAERAEAELATERARLDWLIEGRYPNRESVDKMMQEDAK